MVTFLRLILAMIMALLAAFMVGFGSCLSLISLSGVDIALIFSLVLAVIAFVYVFILIMKAGNYKVETPKQNDTADDL